MTTLREKLAGHGRSKCAVGIGWSTRRLANFTRRFARTERAMPSSSRVATWDAQRLRDGSH